MAALQKNVASQNFAFSLVNASSGAASTTTSTSSLTAFVTKDGTQASAGGTFTYLGTGEWNYAPTQAETNCTNFALYVTASSNIPFHGTVWTDLTDSGGNIQVDTTKFGGTTVTARDIGASVLVSSGTGTGQLAISSGVIQSNLTQINGVSVTSSSTGLGVNVVTFGGTAVTGRDLGTSVLLSSGTGTGQLNIVSGVAQVNATQIGGQTASLDANNLLKVDVEDINGSATAGQALKNSTLSICWGTASSGTTTTVVASSINNPSTVTDIGQLIGRTIIFLGNTGTADVQAQASNITNSTTGATPTITYTAMTHAPANGDTFVVL